MSQGQKAADETKGAFKAVGDMGEDIRKNVNFYADNLLGGNKSHGSSGFSSDAQQAGKDIQKGADSVAQKINKQMDKK